MAGTATLTDTRPRSRDAIRARGLISFLHPLPVAPSALHGSLLASLSPSAPRSLVEPKGGGRSVECQSGSPILGAHPNARRGDFWPPALALRNGRRTGPCGPCRPDRPAPFPDWGWSPALKVGTATAGRSAGGRALRAASRQHRVRRAMPAGATSSRCHWRHRHSVPRSRRLMSAPFGRTGTSLNLRGVRNPGIDFILRESIPAPERGRMAERRRSRATPEQSARCRHAREGGHPVTAVAKCLNRHRILGPRLRGDDTTNSLAELRALQASGWSYLTARKEKDRPVSRAVPKKHCLPRSAWPR
jgi:hypothetical protein